MKTVKDLIEALQKLPKDLPVSVFDVRKNMGISMRSGESCSEGIYDVSVEIINDPEEMKDLYDDDTEIPKPWVAISFENDDYDDDGKCIADVEREEQTESTAKASWRKP